MELCKYGCGQPGIYQFKNGARCCSEFVNSCPSMRAKISRGGIGNKNSLGYKHTPDSRAKMSPRRGWQQQLYVWQKAYIRNSG